MRSYRKVESELLLPVYINKKPSTNMNPSPVYVGIDIAKKTLAVSAPGMKKQYTNTPLGHAQLIQALPENAHVVMEATGGYERDLSLCLHAKAIAVSVVNPRHVRDFAKAMGQLAKSDNIDAQMIVAFARAKVPRPDSAPSQRQIELEELMARREQLVALRSIELNRREHHRQKLLKVRADKLIATIEVQIEEIEAKVRELIESEASLKSKRARMLQVEGIGEITAASVPAFVPELGRVDRSQAAALVGVAPFVCESGMERGKSHIWGGRANVRTCFYMAALTAIRNNRILRDFYQRLRAAGKPGKVAIVAVMRKLVCLLNHRVSTKEWGGRKIW
ncbi:MAG: IS110 family transposase [Chthoniobacteraceae bacterium]